MEMLVGSLAILFISASAIDWLLGMNSKVDLRVRLREAGATRGQGLYTTIVTSANFLFCDLFDAIYGEEFWSWRRFSRSCLLSLVALLFVGLWFGLDVAYGKPDTLTVPWYTLSYIVGLGINLVADYISLQETRWVLGRARSGSIMAVLGWVCIDLALTFLVFIAVFCVAFGALTLAGRPPGDISFFLFTLDSPILDPSRGLPFLLSTFGTSVLWLLFVVFVLVVTAMRKSSRFLGLVYDAVADNRAPARAVATIIALPVIVVGLILIYAL